MPVLASQMRPGLAPAGHAPVSAPVPSGGGASSGSLDPIKLLLKYKWLLLVTVVLGAALGVASHYALLRVYPRWTARALFIGRPQSTDIKGNNAYNEVEMNRFLQTEARVIVGPSVLRAVAEDPRLVTQAPHWSKQFTELDASTGRERLNEVKATKELEDVVRARAIANTAFIELSMTYVKPEDATTIVGLVKEKYLDRVNSRVRNEQQERASALTRELDTINAEIQTLTARRDSLIQRGSVDSLNEQASTVRAELNKISDTEIELRQDLEATRKQLQQFEEEKNNPAGSSIGDSVVEQVERDPVVLDIKQQIAGVESELQSMRNRGIGINNPQYKILLSRQEGFVARLEEERNKQQRKAFDGELDRARRAVQQLESQELEVTSRKEELRRRVIELTGAARQVETLEEELRGKQDLRTKLSESKIEQKIIDQGGGYDRVALEEPERMPSIPSFPKLEVLIPAGILVLTGLVGGLVFVRELIDQRVKGPGDVALIPRARLLGWVPDAAEDPSGQGNVETSLRDRPKGIVAESFRQLRASIVRRVAAGDHRTVLFVGSLPGSGTTTAVLNTALAFASTDKRVLVIDANFRRPALHKALGLQDSPGLADALAGRDLASLVQATSTPNLDLLSAGSKEQRVFERLGAAAMSDVLAKARAAYDIVLIDTAPAVVAGDAMALAQKCDASVLIVRAMAEKRGMIARVKNELTDARAEFLGIVINAVRSAAGGYMKGNIKVASQYQED
jgi:capsular exopolysaccharide synthesis family protein